MLLFSFICSVIGVDVGVDRFSISFLDVDDSFSSFSLFNLLLILLLLFRLLFVKLEFSVLVPFVARNPSARAVHQYF